MYVYMYTHVCMYIYTCIYHMKSRLGQSIETEGRLVAAQGWAGRVGVYQLRGIGSLFFFFFNYLFIYFYLWLCWVFVSVRGLFPVAASGVHSSSRCAGLSLSRPLQTRRLSSCGPRAQPLRGMWDPPGPGIEPVSPALAGRLSTTAPPGKP